MKALKYILSTILIITAFSSCTKDEFGNTDFVSTAVAPTNVSALFKVTQDNTGLVSIAPTADGAVSFEVAFGDANATSASVKPGKAATHTYGEGTYNVSILAKGITGLKTEFSKELIVSFQTPIFGTEPIIENDGAVSKKVNVTVPDDGQFAIFFDVSFVEDGVETIISGNIGETVSYIYSNPGLVDIKVELKGAAIETALFTLTDFEVTEILQPINSAPAQAVRVEADYISVFSDSYTNVAGSDFNPNWGQTGGYTEFDLNGDKMLLYSDINYQGIQIGTAQDVSSMETLHIDVWSSADNSVNFYPLPVDIASENEKYFTLDLIADQWNSFDIPLTYFSDQGLALDNIHQFKFVGSGTIFVDNIYFYKEPTEFADLPITFDTVLDTFEPFLDAKFAIVADPDDATNQVGMITNIGQGWGWEGVKLKLDKWVDVSIIPTIKLDFYNDGAAHDVLIKLEDSTSPLDGNNNPTVFEEVTVNVSNTGWSQLVFNFTSGGNYDTVVLFVDGGLEGIPGTYYFDNVINEEFVALPLTMDTPGQAFEPFLEASFALESDPEDASNSVGMITNIGKGWGWEGVSLSLDEWIDTNVNGTIKMDFYNDGVAHDVLIKLEDSTSPKDGNNNPTIFEEVHVAVSNTAWSELTFNFTSGKKYDTIVIFVDGGVYDITGTYYFDNVLQP